MHLSTALRSLLKTVGFALFVAGNGPLLAQDAQQRASFAYREMQLAEREAEQAAIEAKEIDGQIAELQKQLDAVRKRSASAHAQAKDAKARGAWVTTAGEIAKWWGERIAPSRASHS